MGTLLLFHASHRLKLELKLIILMSVKIDHHGSYDHSIYFGFGINQPPPPTRKEKEVMSKQRKEGILPPPPLNFPIIQPETKTKQQFSPTIAVCLA